MAKTTYKERQQHRYRAAERNAEPWCWPEVDAFPCWAWAGPCGDDQHNFYTLKLPN